MANEIKPSPLISPVEAASAPKKEILHRQKFMGGKMTPQEAHRKWGIGRKCRGCDAPGACRIKVFMPVDEAMKRAPNLLAAIMATNPDESGKLPVVRFKESSSDQIGKDYIKASDTVWCDNCKVEARIEAAKSAPSWAVVEIDDGKKDSIQVGYGS